MGTWDGRDPVGEPAGSNLYQFVGNDPISNIDLLGLDTTGGNRIYPLDPKQLYRREQKICKILSEKSEWQQYNPFDRFLFDTGYWEGWFPWDRRNYQYNGKVYADNEINYFGIGMYEAWKGASWSEAVNLTYNWKYILYWEDDPSPGTLYWLKKGYDDFGTICTGP